MQKSPKYIPDTPHGDDFFKIHTQIAEMLFKTIKSEDLTKDSFTFGLLGSWGSGKSLTVGKLKDKLKDENDVLFFEFDVWKYVDTSLYRSILIDLEKDLKNKADDGKINASYKVGINTSEGKNLHEVLYKSSQISEPKLSVPEDAISKLMVKWSKDKLGKVGNFFILTPASVIFTIIKHIVSQGKLFYFLLIIGILFSCIYYYRSNIETYFPFLNDAYLKPIFKFLAFSVLGLSAVELIKKSFLDLYEVMLPKATSNVIITSPPTFAQDQFETIFKGVIDNISANGTKKLVIVFDNIDRCEPDLTMQILTGLKTFLDQKNCFYLIPCDDIRIKKHLKKTLRAEDDYLDKIIQAYIRIPMIESEDKVSFIEECIKKADFELLESDELKIGQILTYAYKGDTPRQIKRFFNDFISYYRLAEVIDTDKKTLLKDIAYFTFMIAIKQKWPEVETLIVEDSNFFKESNHLVSSTKMHEDCVYFVEKCSSWINHDIDPAIFIYLKDSKNSSTQVQKILLEDSDDFILTTSLIQQISQFVAITYSKGKILFFENSIERLKQIIEKRKAELPEKYLIELFKIYILNILNHQSSQNPSKNGSFFISHAKFISQNIDLVNKIDFNRINAVQENICDTLRKTGHNEDMEALYSSVIGKFHKPNLKKIFNQITNEEFKKITPFILLTDKDFIYQICEPKIIENIANDVNFQKDESEFLKILVHVLATSDSVDAQFITSTKFTQSIQQVVSHTQLHPHDTYVLNGLEMLPGLKWNSADKPNFDSYLNTRINVLFQHGQNDLAVNYCIQGLAHNGAHMIDTFAVNGNNNLGQKQFFNIFIQKITSKILVDSLSNVKLKDEILKLASNYNLSAIVLEKIEIQHLRNNLEFLSCNNIDWLLALLSIPESKRNEAVNEKSDSFEKRVVDLYIKIYPELIYTKYEPVLPLIKELETQDLLIEKALDYFFKDQAKYNSNIVEIIKLYANAREGMTSSVYANHKLLLIEFNNVALFQTLIAKLNEIDRKDYIQRLLGKINNELKSGTNWLDMLYAISSDLSKTELLDNQKVVMELIKELFEISREETYNVIGNLLLNKLKEDSPNRNFNLDKQIELLIASDNKTPEFKTELQKHLNNK